MTSPALLLTAAFVAAIGAALVVILAMAGLLVIDLIRELRGIWRRGL